MSGQGAGLETLKATVRDLAGEQAAPDAPTRLDPGSGPEPFRSGYIPVAPPIIEVVDLHTSYDGKPTLKGVNLAVYPGETMVIMGGSGCGKSTLLKHLIGLAQPDEGCIKLFGQNLAELSPEEMNEVRKKFGILFQSGALYNSMNVFDNVALPLRQHADVKEDVIETVVKIKIDLVELKSTDYYKMPGELSGGMKKRAGLARAIALDPKILFYDEPSAGLDPVVSAKIDELIMNLSRVMGVTSVVVTHEMDSAFRIADRMCMLHKGKVEFVGTKEEVRNSTNPLVHQFINGLTEGPLTPPENDSDLANELLGNG